MTASERNYGCIRDKADQRDHKYTPPTGKLPAQADLRKLCPPVYTQQPLNSCTANAVAAAVQFERMRLKLTPDFVPSRLFIYYNERKLAGTLGKDAGAPLRDGIKSVAKQGDCPEPHWPYVAAKVEVPPSESCYQQAVKYQQVSYQALTQDLAHMKSCLASGHPFVLAIHVYPSSETLEAKQTCTFPTPKAGETSIGTHAVMAVGYDDAKQHLIVRNSWGPDWGQGGYFFLPYDYAADKRYAGDFWTIRIVPAAEATGKIKA